MEHKRRPNFTNEELEILTVVNGGGEKGKITVWELERGDDGSDEAEGMGRGDG